MHYTVKIYSVYNQSRLSLIHQCIINFKHFYHFICRMIGCLIMLHIYLVSYHLCFDFNHFFYLIVSCVKLCKT